MKTIRLPKEYDDFEGFQAEEIVIFSDGSDWGENTWL